MKHITSMKVRELIHKMNWHYPYQANLQLLESAHLIAQPYAMLHFQVHWEMFKLAIRHLVWSEILGQIPRLLLAIPGSCLGKAPKGNIGSTKMRIFEIRED